MKFSAYIIIVISFLLIAACSDLEEPRLISIDKVELLSDNADEFIFNTNVKVYNPNWFSLKSKDITFSIYIDTFFIGNAKIPLGINVPKNDTSNIISILSIKKKSLNSSINIKDSVLVAVNGTTKIPYINKDFDFNFEYKLDLSNYISPIADDIISESDIQIKEVRIKSIDLMKIKLEVLFNFKNSTNTKFEITKLDINIYDSNSYSTLIGNTSLNKSFTILADTVNIFKTDVSINTLSMGTALFSNTVNNSNSFYIKVMSIINYNNIDIPIVIKRKIDYNPLTLEIKLND